MKRNLFLLVACSFLISCGGRVPSPQTAHDIIQKQFVKYGKKYKETDFGKGLQKVEIVQVQELQKNLAGVEAYLHLGDTLTYRVWVTLQKKPFGWKQAAWENLGGR